MMRFNLISMPLLFCSPHGQSAAMPTPSLEFANICLHNAWQLLPKLKIVSETSPPLTPVGQLAGSSGGDSGEQPGGEAVRNKDGGQDTFVSTNLIPPIRSQDISGLR